MFKKLITVLVTARPSWSKLAPVVACLRLEPTIHTQVIGAAFALTHDRGGVVDPAFQPDIRLTAALDANTGESSAITMGLLTMQLAQQFARDRPDLVIVNHDRFETLAVSVAASYQRIPLLHLGGGETSGNIDQRVRWANSMLADVHCCATLKAAERLRAAGCTHVHATGCPSIDLAKAALGDPAMTREELDQYGTGVSVDPLQPFALIVLHPTTTHPWTWPDEWEQACQAVGSYAHVCAFWPGADDGHDTARKYIVETGAHRRMKLVRSLPPARFLRLLAQSAYVVGNSSAIVRERSYYGTPYTLMGDRQQGREIEQGPSCLYGDGQAAPRIAEVCLRLCRSGGG